MAIEVSTVTLPDYWASALVNGDYSGLALDEIERLDAALDEIGLEGWVVVSCEGEPRYTNSYHLYDPGSGCSGGCVLDYTVHRATEL